MRRALTGWGRTRPTVADVLTPDSEESVVSWLSGLPAPRGVIARGMGRSYGDAAQNGGGSVVDVLPFDRIGPVAADGVVQVGAGVTMDALMRAVVPHGWFVPVTPGTRFVTIGGAIAADIHGKNHHADGSLSRHVLAVRLATPALGVVEVGPGDELFDATLGGMGLTGVVVDATIRLIPVDTSSMLVDTERAPDLDHLLARLAELDTQFRYTVAWVDVLARGSRLGRAVITAGEHAPMTAVEGRGDPRRFDPPAWLRAPAWVPDGLLNPLTIAAFNEAWYRKAPAHRRDEVQPIATFFHPLDGVRDWNRLYGRRGFLQYQTVVPDRATELLRTMIETFATSRLPGFLAVLKRFGAGASGHLSFPMPGWTLTVDLPAHPDLAPILDEMDDRVAEAGGRVYLAKDARMKARHLPVMYPRLEDWRRVRDAVDPRRVLQSDLGRRLGL